MAAKRSSHAEVKAGLFVTFCLGLFVAMLFVYGKINRGWRGQRELRVAFTDVNTLRADAPVQYNGMEVGKVRATRILQVDDALLRKLPVLTEHDLEKMPLTEAEIEALRGVGAQDLDAAIREKIQGRNIVVLTLEVLSEGDPKRYRAGDQVRVNANLMGETIVEIVSGGGDPLLPVEDPPYLVGAGGNMYSHLAQSMTQVKDIMSSMSEMIGGGVEDDSPLARQLENFDQFTARIETMSGNMEQQLPATWDKLDQKLHAGGERLKGVQRAVDAVRPDLEKSLLRAEAGLTDVRKRIESMTEESRDQVQRMRRRLQMELEVVGEMAEKYKEEIPVLVRETREQADQIQGRVHLAETWMRDSERYMMEGAASTRQLFRALRESSDTLEEKGWYLSNYPWAFVDSPSRDGGFYLDAAWRRALFAKHYWELRAELDAVCKGVQATDPSDRARLQRIREILTGFDAYLPRPGTRKSLE